MVVEIISVGTELLMGNIVNTNAQHIAQKLAHMGLDAYYQTVVGDNPERLRAALDVAYTRGDCVITTGGLGPTKDDLTKEMLISYFGCTPVEDEEALRRLQKSAAFPFQRACASRQRSLQVQWYCRTIMARHPALSSRRTAACASCSPVRRRR